MTLVQWFHPCEHIHTIMFFLYSISYDRKIMQSRTGSNQLVFFPYIRSTGHTLGLHIEFSRGPINNTDVHLRFKDKLKYKYTHTYITYMCICVCYNYIHTFIIYI